MMTTYISGPLITKVSEIRPLSVVTADKGYDSEDNHVLVREELHAFSVIPARYEHVPIWRAHCKYSKQMKRGGYCKLLYNQRNKEETILSVIKRLFGEHVTSRSVKTQNRELSFRCIAYNMHRLTNLVIILMVSIEPQIDKFNIYRQKIYRKKAFLKKLMKRNACSPLSNLYTMSGFITLLNRRQ